MVVELIDRILIHEGGRVEVVFRFGNPFCNVPEESEAIL